MNVLDRMGKLLKREKGLGRARVESLSRLPGDERIAALGAALHEACVKSAARFVEQEIRRPDSPFRELAKADFFHEMLVMNFWIFEWLFGGKRPALMEQVYRHYHDIFIWGWETSEKELLDSMRRKFRTYDKAWDDYSGHQDVFARQAIGIIFSGRQCVAAPQAAFWLISHADETMKEFAAVRKSVDQVLGSNAGPAS